MANFDYRKAVKENKATFHASLTEGQFSWMTQDTDQQIGSEKENTIPVYMFDNKGKYYYENSYDGYGEFGGKDYYDLVAEMNGYTKDDAYELGGTFKELRGIGIKLAFGELEPKNGGPVLFPALVADPNRFDYKTHDFTQEAENDPNQSWYSPEEEEDEDDNYSWEDQYGDDEEYDDEEELEEGIFDRIKAKVKGTAASIGQGAKNIGATVQGRTGDIKSTADVNTMTQFGVKTKTFGKQLDDMVKDLEKLFPEDKLSKLDAKTKDVVSKYMAALGDIKAYNDKFVNLKEDTINENKMKASELKAKIKEMILSEMHPKDEPDEMESGAWDMAMRESEKINETNNPRVWKMFDLIRDNMDDSQFLQELIAAMDTDEAIANLGHIIQMWDLDSSLNEYEKNINITDENPESEEDFLAEISAMLEADDEETDTEETETEEEVDVDVEEPVPTDEPVGDGGIKISQNADADLTGVEKEVQDNLEAAMEAAKKLEDEKLTKQIGNSLTFFTRQHVVKEDLNESMFPMLKKILK